ncbi:hypothetical protein [Treponema denticola]|uniref:hypothetical protein n=1 Tax=Treponema denticola TaxID=158 RepID=UPI0020A60168|nr:hypothetical protein [Treponema denticola]
MIWKRTAGSYQHSHKKITKSFEKALDIKQPIGQNSQLHSFTASQLHSFTASQLRGSCAQINLNINYSNRAQRQAVSQSPASCPWAFFIHRLKNRKERKALSFAQLRKGL